MWKRQKKKKPCAAQIYPRPTLRLRTKPKPRESVEYRPLLLHHPLKLQIRFRVRRRALTNRGRGDDMQIASTDPPLPIRLAVVEAPTSTNKPGRKAPNEGTQASAGESSCMPADAKPSCVGYSSYSVSPRAELFVPSVGDGALLLQSERIRASQRCVVVTARLLRIAKNNRVAPSPK